MEFVQLQHVFVHFFRLHIAHHHKSPIPSGRPASSQWFVPFPLTPPNEWPQCGASGRQDDMKWLVLVFHTSTENWTFPKVQLSIFELPRSQPSSFSVFLSSRFHYFFTTLSPKRCQTEFPNFLQAQILDGHRWATILPIHDASIARQQVVPQQAGSERNGLLSPVQRILPMKAWIHKQASLHLRLIQELRTINILSGSMS